MKILMIDDHGGYAKSLQFYLSFNPKIEKFSYHLNADGLSETLRKEKPDILLLDIQLKGENGLKVGQRVLAEFPDQKIIFHSGHDLLEYHSQAINMGAKAFIDKNSDPEKLFDVMKIVMAGKTVFPKFYTDVEPLTDREKEILQLTADGLKQKEIAETLFLSVRTVANHIQSINEKFHVNSSISAVVRGIELGIVDKF
ncbi:response regulator [Enterococcus sp. LJL51]|uniref:response regulator transcription factor n=1 Tax=Enterococcus sp. LJL51 TaxID=3416656 RepID=UPI003CE8E31C